MYVGARRHGQGELMGKGDDSLPWKCCKVVFVLQILSKVSVDAVFVHYFEKMSATEGFAPRLPPGL